MDFRIPIGPLISILFLAGDIIQAQTPNNDHLQANNFAVGISTGHYGYDPAAGINITSPSFLRNHFSLRLQAGLHGSEAYKSSYRHWASYQSYSLGIEYHTNIIDKARFYMEFGMLAILPDSRFSEKRYLQGVYQFNGLEVFFLNTGRYAVGFYLGVGPTFIKAYAEKLERSPRYGNGIFYVSGLRFYF